CRDPGCAALIRATWNGAGMIAARQARAGARVALPGGPSQDDRAIRTRPCVAPPALAPTTATTPPRSPDKRSASEGTCRDPGCAALIRATWNARWMVAARQ